MAKGKIKKIGLIKEGAPHPVYPSFKFESAHLKEEDAHKAEKKLLDNPKVEMTRIIKLPKQQLIYAKRVPRITPKRPKLRR